MQGLILAAGLGKRLGHHTRDNTKCMVEVNGRRLIDRMLEQLAGAGISRAVIVTGHRGDKLRAHVGDSYDGMPVEYVENPVYAETNNIYSLYLAREYLCNEDTLLLESDLIFEDAVIGKIMADPCPDLVLVDRYAPSMDGTTVILGPDNKILNFVPKNAFDHGEADSYHKTVNIYKFSKEFSAGHYVPQLEAYCTAMGRNEYYEQVLNVITTSDRCDLRALPLDGQKWCEIDDIADLDTAETLFAEQDRPGRYHSRYGGYWRFDDLLDFCYLVNPFFPTARVKDNMRACFDALMCHYPSGSQVNSLLMASNFNLRQQYVAAGNGAAELICSLLAGLKGRIGVVVPTFEEYINRTHAGRVESFTPDNADYSYTVADLCRHFEGRGISVLLLVNPDNPSGNYIPSSEVIRLAAWCARRSIRLVVDESFVDFTDGGTANSLLDNDFLGGNPHVAVLRSISKSYGVPGLRLGILASSDISLIEKIRADMPVWNINSLAEYFMQIIGKYREDYADSCYRLRRERETFMEELRSVPYMRVVPSGGNYFLCELTARYTSARLTELLLNRYYILIKDCSRKYGFSQPRYVRIAVRSRGDNRRLVEALQELAEE